MLQYQRQHARRVERHQAQCGAVDIVVGRLNRRDQHLSRNRDRDAALLQLTLHLLNRLCLQRTVDLVDLRVSQIPDPLLVQRVDLIVLEIYLQLLAVEQILLRIGGQRLDDVELAGLEHCQCPIQVCITLDQREVRADRLLQRLQLGWVHSLWRYDQRGAQLGPLTLVAHTEEQQDQEWTEQ